MIAEIENKSIENKSSVQVLNRLPNGQFPKGISGNPEGPGKGIRFQATEIKKAIYKAFFELGGMEGLLAWANKTPRNMELFYKMVVDLLPKEVSVDGDGNAKIIFVREETTNLINVTQNNVEQVNVNGPHTQAIPVKVCTQ